MAFIGHARQRHDYSVYIKWSDVTESMVTIRSPFCEYNMAYCVDLSGEDLSYWLNYIQSVGLWKRLMITSSPTKRISAISQRKTFIRVLPTRWRRKPAGIEITSLSPYVLIGCSETYTVSAQLVLKTGHPQHIVFQCGGSDWSSRAEVQFSACAVPNSYEWS